MSKIKKNLLSISIAIILVLFIGYGINTFYKSPKYDDFCEEKLQAKMISSQGDCTAEGGKWDQNTIRSIKSGNEEETTVEGWCDVTYTCSKEYDDAREVYNRDVFFISLIAGLIALIIGSLALKQEAVSSGIMGGGVLAIIYGTIKFLGDMSDVYRFIILGVILAILIWMGYKKLKK